MLVLHIIFLSTNLHNWTSEVNSPLQLIVNFLRFYYKAKILQFILFIFYTKITFWFNCWNSSIFKWTKKNVYWQCPLFICSLIILCYFNLHRLFTCTEIIVSDNWTNCLFHVTPSSELLSVNTIAYNNLRRTVLICSSRSFHVISWSKDSWVPWYGFC